MRIAVSGYYGFGNAGDEAVLAATIGELRRRAPHADVVVLSADPAATEAMHGVTAALRWPLGPARRAIASADLLLSGGGSLLQNATSTRSLGYYLMTLAMARHAKVPYIIHAQGLGPLQGWLPRRMTAGALQKAAAITLRDMASVELARGLGVPDELLTLTADSAFLLEPVGEAETTAVLADAGAGTGERLIGMAVREWAGARAMLAPLAEVGRIASERWEARTVILPFQHPADIEVSRELAALIPGALVVERELRPGALMGIVGRLDMLVAMRLHALIFAAARAIPAVGIVYDPKVSALCASVEHATVRMDSPEELPELAGRAWAERDQRAEVRRSRSETMRKRAAAAFETLEPLLH